jgi:hypothetical protein
MWLSKKVPSSMDKAEIVVEKVARQWPGVESSGMCTG